LVALTKRLAGKQEIVMGIYWQASHQFLLENLMYWLITFFVWEYIGRNIVLHSFITRPFFIQPELLYKASPGRIGKWQPNYPLFIRWVVFINFSRPKLKRMEGGQTIINMRDDIEIWNATQRCWENTHIHKIWSVIVKSESP